MIRSTAALSPGPGAASARSFLPAVLALLLLFFPGSIGKPAPAGAGGKEKKDRWLAVTGGEVHTVTGPVLRNAVVLAKNGKIAALGRDLHIPEEAERIDARGMRVYPGLVAVSSSGILGREPPERTTDVYGLNMILGLSAGLTTVVTGNTAAKLTYGTLEGMVVRREIFTTLRYSRRSPKARRKLRADLERVRRYLSERRAFELAKSAGDEDVKEPDKNWIRGKYATYLNLLEGKVTALITADAAQDLRDAADLARDFGFRLVIRGGLEAWTLAPELGRRQVSLIITPRQKGGGRRYSSESPDLMGALILLFGGDGETGSEAPPEPLAWGNDKLLRPNGWSIENARVLYESGVPFAIIPQSPVVALGGIIGRDLLMMPMEAAFAVRGGLSEEAALEAITIGPARILGIDDRVGSIEVGKDADLIVCDGDLLHYKTMVQWTVVNGRVVYDKAKESLFAHIRPRGKKGTEPRQEFWPRSFGPMPSFEPETEPSAPGGEPSGKTEGGTGEK